MESIGKVFRNSVEIYHDSCAIKLPKRSLFLRKLLYKEMSFGELGNSSEKIAVFLIKQGIKKGERVFVALKPSFELISTIFALLQIGAVPIVIDPGMEFRKLIECLRRSNPSVLIGHCVTVFLKHLFKSVKVVISSKKLRNLNSSKDSNEQAHILNSKITTERLDSIKKDDLAAILFTSGSTGSPKGVCYQHKQFLAQLEILKSVYSLGFGQIDLPLLSVFALFNPLLGITTVWPEIDPKKPAKLNPSKIAEAIQKCKVTNTFGSPVLLEKIASYCNEKGVKLNSLRCILTAGASISTRIIRNIKKCVPNGEIFTPYGATESLPVSSISASEILKLENKILSGYGTCLGRPIPGCKIRIFPLSENKNSFQSQNTELSACEIGEIVVSGEIVTENYDNLPEETAKSKIFENDSIAHKMGDLGYFDNEHRLWFCGRKVECVITQNGTFYTDCCENVINNHPLVKRSALIGLKIHEFVLPGIVIQPNIWPKKSQQKEILEEIRKFAAKNTILKPINHFFLLKNFPVDVRHNAKIHRLKLAMTIINLGKISF